MKKPAFSFGMISLVALLWSCNPANENVQESEVQPQIQEVKMEKPLLRHVVLIKFKDESSQEDIKKVEEAFIALKDKISLIKDFEWGTNNSPEGLDKGHTHCFFVTFESEQDRDEYLPHPAHKEFVDVLVPHLDDVTVVDYWTK